jgi:hypothetical protein
MATKPQKQRTAAPATTRPDNVGLADVDGPCGGGCLNDIFVDDKTTLKRQSGTGLDHRRGLDEYLPKAYEEEA